MNRRARRLREHALVSTSRVDPLLAYTDGACKGNPGPGGWAWAVPGGAWAAGPSDDTTNQRMEITAAYEAVRSNPGRLEVVSDSTYVVNCFRDRWWEGWIARGWKNTAKKPVANRDLWEPFVELVRDRGDVTFRWVKGHSSDPMNDLVDRLAVEASSTQRARSGSEPPTEVGPADRTPFQDEGSALPGHSFVVFGHRPPELGGYDNRTVHDRIRRQIREILEAKLQLHDDLVVVSGLRLGAEMLGAEAAYAAGVPVVAVLPYPDPEAPWPAESRTRFRALRDRASDVVLLQRKAPESKQKAGAALARRDAWLARNAAEALIVWDRSDPVLARLARSLEDHLGDDVWILDPAEHG